MVWHALSLVSYFDYTMDFPFQKTFSVYSWRAAEQHCRVLMLMQPRQLKQRALGRIFQGAKLSLKVTSQADSEQPLCAGTPGVSHTSINGTQTTSLLSTHMCIYKHWKPLTSSLGFTFSSSSWIQLDLHTGSVIFTKGRQPLFLWLL